MATKLFADKHKARGSLVSTWFGYLNQHATTTLLALFIFSLAAFLASIAIPRADGMLIGSDGVGYYMYVRSIVIDQDIDFANEYAHFYQTKDQSTLQTPAGLTTNQYAIGPAILWFPFFMAGHLISLLLKAVGVPAATDGYSYLYQAAICIGSIVYGSIGMLLMLRTLRRLFPETALATCILLWLATSFIYYLIIEPSMSHMCSLFATSLLVYLWTRFRPTRRLRECLYLGLAGGLVGLVRQPDATLLLLPVVDYFFQREPIVQIGKRLILTAAGFLAVFWAQLLVWYVLNGSPFKSGYLIDGQQGFTWLAPHLLAVLFSTEHGLFLWHPVLLFAFIGILLIFLKDRLFGCLLLLGLLSQAYIIASWSSWTQADAFGGRMFIASYPLLAIGLAAILRQVTQKPGWKMAAILTGIVLVLWNALFLVQYRLGFISMAGPYTLRELTLGKAEMVLAIIKRILG